MNTCTLHWNEERWAVMDHAASFASVPQVYINCILVYAPTVYLALLLFIVRNIGSTETREEGQEINCSFISLSIVLKKKENRPSWIPTWVSQHSSNDRRWLMKSRHREFLYDDCHRCGRSSSDANGRKKRREAQCTESKYCYQVVLRIANWRRTYK